ncbi:MAG: hypothetical protein A2086_14770 [Spirochaetes bacterium GWD1_27_9]|nr:MAG: hypothetical protein A2Z98_04970 [Spirochaetes bacterium GWB1_27_13]OHD35922.1 MAG: hypothetical protein A2086_14770 [Spirochaetes bacterium GWD1_27_9]
MENLIEKKMKILIVDDETANIFLLRGLLEDQYILEEANNGISAMDKVMTFSPDLILLDVMMPGVSGIDVCKKLSADVYYKDIPIILITAKTEDEDVKVGLESGAFDYIKKPFSDVELMARVKSSLRIRQYILKLKELNTIKDEFVSMVSHDLRTPLTTMLGYTDMLLEGKLIGHLNNKQKEMLKEIYKAGHHQFKIIKDLLNLSMIESGKIKINKTHFILFDSVKRMVDELKFKIIEKNLKLNLLISDSLSIYADEERLAQVFSNLIGNAIKFTNDGGLIEVSLEEKEDEFLIFVKDNGIGIAEKNLKTMLDQYKIFTTYSTSGEKGTGLGINICIKIISAHGGKLWAESEINKGSTFYFTIPKT